MHIIYHYQSVISICPETELFTLIIVGKARRKETTGKSKA
jgi:hypothetical protein